MGSRNVDLEDGSLDHPFPFSRFHSPPFPRCFLFLAPCIQNTSILQGISHVAARRADAKRRKVEFGKGCDMLRRVSQIIHKFGAGWRKGSSGLISKTLGRLKFYFVGERKLCSISKDLRQVPRYENLITVLRECEICIYTGLKIVLDFYILLSSKIVFHSDITCITFSCCR